MLNRMLQAPAPSESPKTGKRRSRSNWRMRILPGRMVWLGVLIFFHLGATGSDWPFYGGDPTNAQYSPDTTIHRQNVQHLVEAWRYHSEAKDPKRQSQIQCNPLIVEGVLYGTSPKLKVFALDADTGKERWSFDPFEGQDPVGVNRGLVHWASQKNNQDRRILITAGHWLYALDSATGKPVASFGQNGRVNLREGLGRETDRLFVLSNTPGILFENRLIIGTRVSEGPGPAAPGHIRAYNVLDGSMEWIFHTIPQPGEMGIDTWPEEAWKTMGGANTWSGMSLDIKRGWIFCPTGSPAFDFWGGNRHGRNLFGNCLLVLDARSGKRIWHYQVVHHDLWDRDLPAAPNLIELNMDGKKVEAVAQITKSGHIFAFHRETGHPLFPIQEKPFPPSDLKGEKAWPTQPIPTVIPPFARQSFNEEDVSKLSRQNHRNMKEKLMSVRSGGQFVPPSTAGTVIFPGFDGGGEWGGAAWDPEKQWLYVNANEMPWILTMVRSDEASTDGSATLGSTLYNRLCAVCHGLDRKGDIQKTYPTLQGIETKMNASQMVDQMSMGRGLMPSFGFLSEQEKHAIAAYLLGDHNKRASAQPETEEKPVFLPSSKEPYSHTGYNRFLDSEGYPAIRPPWGTLNAIDLQHGRIAWQVTLGDFADLSARGTSPTGTENYGGPVVTAGGLVFIGATKDETLKAFDKDTGQLLWQAKLPAGGYATPAVYTVDGKPYVVIACGGGKMGTRSGDAYLAFTLPDRL